MSDVNNLVICAEFISSLCVGNLYIGFENEQLPTKVAKTWIRQIVCGKSEITVEIDRRYRGDCANEKNVKLFSVTLPSHLRLLPDTCSGLVHSPYGWLLRLNFLQQEEDNGKHHESTIASGAPTTTEPATLECRACGNQLLLHGNVIRSRIRVADLGLPPGMDWELMNLSYFCHDHSCHGDDSGHTESDTVGQTMFVPRETEMFVGDSYYVINAAVVNFTNVIASPSACDDRELRCDRCHCGLGKVVGDLANAAGGGAVKLTVDGVAVCIESESNMVRNPEILLKSFLGEGNTSGRRIALYAEGKHLEDRLLLLWIMDKNLKTLFAHFTETAIKIPANDLKSVCKVLYRYLAVDSPVCEQWISDPTVKSVKISEQLLIKLTTILTESTDKMPRAWRYANDFLVGYMPTIF